MIRNVGSEIRLYAGKIFKAPLHNIYGMRWLRCETNHIKKFLNLFIVPLNEKNLTSKYLGFILNLVRK